LLQCSVWRWRGFGSKLWRTPNWQTFSRSQPRSLWEMCTQLSEWTHFWYTQIVWLCWRRNRKRYS
jgi:hypothetical protein